MTEEEQVRIARMEQDVAGLTRRLKELATEHTTMIQKLQVERENRQRPTPPSTENSPFKRVFDAQITGFSPTSGTPYMWKEAYVTSASIGLFTSGRRCTSLTSGGAAVELNGWKFIPSGTYVQMTEYRNASVNKFAFCATVPAVPNPNIGYTLEYASATRQMKWALNYVCSA